MPSVGDAGDVIGWALLMAHVFQYRKSRHGMDVVNLQRSRYGAGKLSIPPASSLISYKTLAMSRTHDLFLAL